MSSSHILKLKAGRRVAVVMPAFNEEESIGRVIGDIPEGLVDEVIVVDNRSTDRTAEVAREAGATVLFEGRRGYGSACLKGVAHALDGGFDIVVFLDADYSDHPEEMPLLVEKITRDGCQLVIGSRTLGNADRGALLPQARFGNMLATALIRLFFGVRYTDLGPFRAITADALRRIAMVDTNYGWTVEMQVKAARVGLRVAEVPVSYRKRIGVSKITGTVKGTIHAGWKILITIGRYVLDGL